jgi:hypothetical protein
MLLLRVESNPSCICLLVSARSYVTGLPEFKGEEK